MAHEVIWIHAGVTCIKALEIMLSEQKEIRFLRDIVNCRPYQAVVLKNAHEYVNGAIKQ